MLQLFRQVRQRYGARLLNKYNYKAFIMKKEEFSYDKAMQELEEIVARMESSENSLDKMVADVKKASALIVQCRKKLQDVEADINKALVDISE